MLKTCKIICTAVFLIFAVLFGVSLRDKQTLRNDLIRLHVVADSDSAEDQSIKLMVRDAVIRAVEKDLQTLPSVTEAKVYLQNNLTFLEKIANETLKAAGSKDTATISLGLEAFPVREYDTFKLPSGVYESLRVKIGSGEGRNWWCVVFPSFCIRAFSEDFESSAVSAGFSDSLVHTLSGDEGYEISFFFLDCLGKLENFFHFR